MKRLDEIESMGMDEMLRISSDESVSVPEDLHGRLAAAVASRAMNEERAGRRRLRRKVLFPLAGITGVAAAVLLAVMLSRPSVPEDTFDDPLVAYAEVEKVFSLMSDKIAPGVKNLNSKVGMLNRPKEIIDRINDKNDKK